MNLQFGMLAGAIVLGFLGTVFSLVCFSSNRKNGKLIEALIDHIEEIETELSENKDLLEDGKIRATDQARRIAWLEARIRKPEKVKKDILSQEVLTTNNSAKQPNMTERRHRVLTLASRGQDADTIATNLGMFKGEVEFIMSLGRGIGKLRIENYELRIIHIIFRNALAAKNARNAGE